MITPAVSSPAMFYSCSSLFCTICSVPVSGALGVQFLRYLLELSHLPVEGYETFCPFEPTETRRQVVQWIPQCLFWRPVRRLQEVSPDFRQLFLPRRVCCFFCQLQVYSHYVLQLRQHWGNYQLLSGSCCSKYCWNTLMQVGSNMNFDKSLKIQVNGSGKYCMVDWLVKYQRTVTNVMQRATSATVLKCQIPSTQVSTASEVSKCTAANPSSRLLVKMFDSPAISISDRILNSFG